MFRLFSNCCFKFLRKAIIRKIRSETLFFIVLAVVSASFILFVSAVILIYPDSTPERKKEIQQLFDKSAPKQAPETTTEASTTQVTAWTEGRNPFTASTLYQPPVQAVARSFNILDEGINLNNKEEKIILLWTAWWKDKTWRKIFKRNGGPFVKLPPFLKENGEIEQRRSCRLSLNRTLQKHASSFVFHSYDLQPNNFDDVPIVRQSSQVWVFWMIEPPPRSGLLNNHDWDRANAMDFNITMSYLRHSDVFFPYGRIYEYPINTRRSIARPVRHRIDGFVRDFSERPVDAVWIVSDCTTYSGREKLVHELVGAGISIDSWGNCSQHSPDKEWEHFGRKKFFTRYRYYLAFENTFCDDYVSEKAFVAMNMSRHYGLIPVVYGAARYSTILPPGSFIDVKSFQNIQSLAGYLKLLALPQNADLVKSYFAWQYKYFTDQNENMRVISGWQSLCQRLWDMDLSGQLVNSSVTIKNLRSRMGECTF